MIIEIYFFNNGDTQTIIVEFLTHCAVERG